MYKIIIAFFIITLNVNAQDISLNISSNQLLYTLGEPIIINFDICNKSNITYNVKNTYTINDYNIFLKDDMGKIYIQKKLFSMSSNMDIINPNNIIHQSYDITDVIKISHFGWYKLYVNKRYLKSADDKVTLVKSNITYFKICSSMSSSLLIKINHKVIKDHQINLALSIQNASDIDFDTDLFNYNLLITDISGELMIDKLIKPDTIVKNILHPGDVLSLEYTLDAKDITLPDKFNIYSYIRFKEKNSTVEDFFVSNNQLIKMGEQR